MQTITTAFERNNSCRLIAITVLLSLSIFFTGSPAGAIGKISFTGNAAAANDAAVMTPGSFNKNSDVVTDTIFANGKPIRITPGTTFRHNGHQYLAIDDQLYVRIKQINRTGINNYTVPANSSGNKACMHPW